MTIQIEMPADEKALVEFVGFHDRVYQYRAARWPSAQRRQLHILTGQAPFKGRLDTRCFTAREAGSIVARAAAVIDHRYNEHWNEPVGHLMMFEAMPGSTEAVKPMINAACEWLRGQGMRLARAGAESLLDAPFAIDEYEALPPSILRQNPDYYHSLLKDAGFEIERGWVDYKIEVTSALIARYEAMLEAARRDGFVITPTRDLPADLRVSHFTRIWNHAFLRHWGMAPRSEAEVASMFRGFARGSGLETTLIAYRGTEPVGVLNALRSTAEHALLAPGRAVREAEKLNWLGIGVHESARGRGVNLAMASYAYLELIHQGAKYLSYTLVLDDNWPSRRTAEKLGAKVCASYVTYRRKLA